MPTNATLQADVIARVAMSILDNELGWLKKLHRAHESEFTSTVNGYKVGDTISIKRPVDFTVRETSTMDLQNILEGKTTLTVDQIRGVDFGLTSTELTLDVSEVAERYIKPAVINIVNSMAKDVAEQMYKGFYNWVGTAGQTINSFSDFAKGPERLDELAVPTADRVALLSPADHWGLLGSQTALYMQDVAKGAYREGSLGNIAGVDMYQSQVVATHTNGTADNTTPLVKGASQEVTYSTAKDTWTQSLLTDGWDTVATITAGTVFTIDGVYMVNPKTKASTGILQQFVVTADATAQATTTNTTTLTISPPMIISGPHQTVNATAANDATITVIGSASTGYKQNMVFHKNAMSLAVVPLELPQGAVNPARETKNGLSIRVIPIYDGVTDTSKWRLDLLYGRKLVDPRIGTRISGTS